jgi:3-deoxy-D-manno-octulosonic-acid transferase
MGQLFYSISLAVYRAGIHIFSLFNRKARSFLAGRKNIFEQLGNINPEGDPICWMHCASLGEFEQGRPILESFRREFPNYKIVVSFFSPSGYEVQKDTPLADHVCYLPLDSARNARQWVNILRPAIAIFVKYEFWHFYIEELYRNQIPLLSVSSIFRPTQSFFKFYGGFNRKMLRKISHFFVQDSESSMLLNSIGITDVTVSGDTRFDRVNEIRNQSITLPQIDDFVEKEVFIIGSAWPEDMKVLIPFINEQHMQFIIAPHEINEDFINSMMDQINRKCIRYSSGETTGDVMIIDNIGILSSIYRSAKYAWIGGGFGKGLHNILEASVYGIPIFFGNANFQKFREARLLVKRGGAFPISSTHELSEKFKEVSSKESYDAIIEINQQVVQENLGATEKILKYCKLILK